MTRDGSVGTEHAAWWPANPWTNAPMQAGSSTGEFTYTPADDGTFTVVVYQAPIMGFDATYTAK